MTHFKITAIALAAAIPGLAIAQTATTPPVTAPATTTESTTTAPAATTTAPAATTTTAPAATTTTAPAATTTTAPAATMPAPVTTDVPLYVNLINDDSITSRLEEAGYTDVTISRSGSTLTIDATRSGEPTNLVYDLNTGALQTVDGAGYEVPNATTPAASGGETNSVGQTDAPGGESGTDGSSGGDDGDDSGTAPN